MRKLIAFSTVAASLTVASQALAGQVIVVGAPAPLLGAGIPSLAILAITGAGYAVMKMRRKDRD
jgi:hypothetical protein